MFPISPNKADLHYKVDSSGTLKLSDQTNQLSKFDKVKSILTSETAKTAYKAAVVFAIIGGIIAGGVLLQAPVGMQVAVDLVAISALVPNIFTSEGIKQYRQHLRAIKEGTEGRIQLTPHQIEYAKSLEEEEFGFIPRGDSYIPVIDGFIRTVVSEEEANEMRRELLDTGYQENAYEILPSYHDLLPDPYSESQDN